MTHTSADAGRARGLFRDRNTLLALSAIVVGQFGSSSLWLAAGIWVKSGTGSDRLAALTTFTVWAPTLVGPLLGSVADRVRRRPLLVGCNLATAVVLVPLAACGGSGVAPVFCVLAVYGAAGVVQDAAEQALVASALPPRLLAHFNGLRLTVTEGMKLVAPLAGAGLYAAYGGPAVAWLDAAACTASGALFAAMRVREPKPEPVAARAWLTGTLDGMRALRGARAARFLVAVAGATLLLSGLTSALQYAVIDRTLGHAPAFLGVLTPVQGAGSVVTGLLAGRFLRRVPERAFAAGGTALFAVALAARVLPYDTAALAAAFCGGLGLPCALVAAMTAVQRDVPPGVLGSAVAGAGAVVFAPNTVALAAGAWLVDAVDYRAVLVAAAFTGLAVAALSVRVRSAGTTRR